MNARVGLDIQGLQFQYPSGTLAVNKLSLTVQPGEIVAIVGPNGSGKSTFLTCIAGLMEPSLGRIKCGDVEVTADPRRASAFISLMLDPLGLYLDLSVWEYLEFFAKAHGLPPEVIPDRVAAVVQRMELDPYIRQDVQTLSAGWQRRLALGRVLLIDAPILLLDEPAAGLDIVARRSLLETIRGMAREGRTVIITSHILSELAEMADRFGIIKKGSWVPFREGQIFFDRNDLSSWSGSRLWLVRCSPTDKAIGALAGSGAALRQDGLVAFTADNDDQASAALAELVKAGIRITEFRPEANDLGAVAMDLLKEEGK